MKKPPTCYNCILEHKGESFIPATGTADNGVLVIGDAAEKAEVLEGIPFVGQSGMQLDRSISRQNYLRDDFALSNLIQCKPPTILLSGSPWESAIDHCRVHLNEAVHRYKPKVLSLQGDLALKSILGITPLISGRSSDTPKRGYVYPVEIDGHKCLAVPTIHPRFIIQGNQNLAAVHTFDLAKAVNVAENGEEPDIHDYILNPDFCDIESFIEEATPYAYKNDSLIVSDIETSEQADMNEKNYDKIKKNEEIDIIRISFSFKEGHAITILYNEGTHKLIQKLFDLPFDFIGWWNMSFDVPILKSKGYTFKARHLDGMLAWHWLQSDVPKSLGFVSTFFTPFREWKSLDESDPEFYSCRDADATLRNIVAIKGLLQDA